MIAVISARSERIMNELKPMFPKIQAVEEAGGNRNCCQSWTNDGYA